MYPKHTDILIKAELVTNKFPILEEMENEVNKRQYVSKHFNKQDRQQKYTFTSVYVLCGETNTKYM